MTRYGSRKFLAALAALACATWALARSLLDSGDYTTLVLGTIGVYVAGNVAQRAVQAKQQQQEAAK